MTDELRMEIFRLHHHGFGVNEIARELSRKHNRKIWPNTIRWVLDRAKLLGKERDRRKARGAADYKCSVCGEPGHNKKSHGVERE